MGKTINQLTGEVTDHTDITGDAEMEIQLAGESTTKKVTMTVLVAALSALGLGGGGDVTPPTVVSMTVEDANPDELIVVFDEAVTGVVVGDFSFKKNGSAWADSSVTGAGTTWTFTMASAAAYGDVLLGTYSGSGTIDGAANALAAFTDVAVTNSVAAAVIVEDDFTGTGNLTAHTPAIGGAISKLFSSTGNIVLSGVGSIGATTPHSTAAFYGYTNVFSGADQKCTAIINKNGNVANGDYDAFSLCVRVDSSTGGFTGYYAQFIDAGPAGGTSMSINKMVNGVNTSLTSDADTDGIINDGNDHEISMEITGSLITVKLDGSTLDTVTDSALTAGRRVAIYTYSINPTSAQWLATDFTAEDI